MSKLDMIVDDVICRLNKRMIMNDEWRGYVSEETGAALVGEYTRVI